MITTKDLETKFNEIAPKYFSDVGFVLDSKAPLTIINESYFDNKDISFIGMSLLSKRVFQYRSISFCWFLYFPKVEHFWLKYRHMVGRDNAPIPKTIFFLKPHLERKFIDNSKYNDFIINTSGLKLSKGAELIEDINDFEEILNITSEQYSNEILNYINKKCDLQWLDSIINTSIDSHHPRDMNISTTDGHMFRRIIVAKITANRDYSQIINYYKEIYMKSFKDTGSNSALLNYNALIELDKDLSQYKDYKDFDDLLL